MSWYLNAPEYQWENNWLQSWACSFVFALNDCRYIFADYMTLYELNIEFSQDVEARVPKIVSFLY